MRSDTVREATQPAAPVPAWLKELASYHGREIVHQFVLHGNVYDLVPGGSPADDETVRSLLGKVLREKAGFGIVLFYSLTGGFVAADRATANLLNGLGAGGFVRLEEIADKLQFTIEPPMPVERAFSIIDRILRQKETKAAVIIEHLDQVAPAGEGKSAEQARCVEYLQRWAQDPPIQRETDNLLIGMTDTLGRVEESLFGPASRCRLVRVPLPDEQERRAFIEREIARATSADSSFRVESEAATLARRTNGFNYQHIADLFSLPYTQEDEETRLGLNLVGRMKREIIRSGSRNLLEEKEPRHGFDAIGGLQYIKEYLRRVKGYIDTDRALVPKAILLAGPPGTGKTLIAEALAKETGWNVVKMGNIRSMWVGESERNLSAALQLITDHAPVVVFVDEIDQALGSRGTGRSGDSGVGERMFGKILEFMGSNEHRGRVLWVAATNRADVLDEAMIRRFDRVFPVLLPGSVHERLAIVKGMKQQIEGLVFGDVTEEALKAALHGNPATDGDAEANGWQKFSEATEGLSGSDLEVIARRAKELAAGESVNTGHLLRAHSAFKSNHHQDMYDLQTLLAVAVCNFVDTIPPVEAFPERLQPMIKQVMADRHNVSLDNTVAALKQRLGVKRLV